MENKKIRVIVHEMRHSVVGCLYGDCCFQSSFYDQDEWHLQPLLVTSILDHQKLFIQILKSSMKRYWVIKICYSDCLSFLSQFQLASLLMRACFLVKQLNWRQNGSLVFESHSSVFNALVFSDSDIKYQPMKSSGMTTSCAVCICLCAVDGTYSRKFSPSPLFFLCIIKDGKTKFFCVRVLYVFNIIGMDRWIYMACINKKKI